MEKQLEYLCSMHDEAISQLQNVLAPYLDNAMMKQARIHCGNGYVGDFEHYYLRDDELSSGIIGSKWRKYTSLLPWLKKQGKTVNLSGSEHSNNLLGLAQLLVEQGLDFTVYAKKSHDTKKGNGLWLNSICGHKLHCIQPDDWPALLDELKQNPETILLPEGASVEAAIPGMLTMLLDVLVFEQQQDKVFQTICLDAGTGFTAACLVAGLELLQTQKRQVHIAHIANDQASFQQCLKMVRSWIKNTFHGTKFKTPVGLHHHASATAKSFGAVNRTLVAEWEKFMQTEGFIPDLLYSQKLFYTMKQHFNHNQPTQSVLIAYCGNSFAAQNHRQMAYRSISA